jgi:hypothetical protein
MQLKALRQQLVKEIKECKPWPGVEFGKVILGMALDAALQDQENS